MRSAPKSRTEANKAEKHARILDAATALFAERGYAGTAVPPVAERARVAAGTIYRFFDNKEALVNAVFRRAKQALGEALFEGLDLEQAPRPLFDEFWARLYGFAREQPEAFRFLELQDHHRYLDETSRHLERTVLAPVAVMVLQFRELGVFEPALPVDVAMAFIWGGFVGVMKAERDGHLEVDQRAVDAARDMAWRSCARVQESP